MVKSPPDDLRELALVRVGQVIRGKYRLDRLIGVGGMAAVYAATHRNQNRVAIKILHDRLAHDIRIQKLFRREAYVANKVSHPDVVGVFDDDVTEDGCGFLVLPLLRGETLQRRWERKDRRMHVHEVVLLAKAVLDVLNVAHASNVVHRDIKPENLFLTCDGALKLLDFGIARVMEGPEGAALTQSGCVVGTPSFMAPEQALGRSHLIDGRTDLWALGATMFTLGAGVYTRESSGLSDGGIYAATRSVRPMRSVAPDIPESIAAVVDKALLVDRSARWPDARAMQEALLAAFANEYGALSVDLKSYVADNDPPVSKVDATDIHDAPTRPPNVDRPAGQATIPFSGSSDDATSNVQSAEGQSTTKEPEHDPAYWATEDNFRQTHSSQARELIGTVIGGQYRLIKVLGVGGMGAVFEAQDGNGKIVAIKTLLPDSPAMIELGVKRFVREASATITIRSPYVVRVFEAAADLHTKIPFIVMERLHGCDLGQLIESQGRLDIPVATRILWEACQGLAVVHQAGMVHRDVKPSNIFLHRDSDGKIVTKLCDFGIAKQPDGAVELTHTGMLLGSPMYMAPEQAQNAKLADVRSDVWSMAITLYQVLRGKHPWAECKTFGEVLKCLYTMDVPALGEVAPWVDADLAEVVHRGLRRDPDQRYGDAREFAHALEPFAAHESLGADLLPVEEFHPNLGGPRGGTSNAVAAAAIPRTNRRLALAAGIVILVALLGAIGWGTRMTGVHSSWVAVESSSALGLGLLPSSPVAPSAIGVADKSEPAADLPSPLTSGSARSNRPKIRAIDSLRTPLQPAGASSALVDGAPTTSSPELFKSW